MRNQPAPVAICIDVEPDEFFMEPLSRPAWTGFEVAARRMAAFRDMAQSEGRDARFNWFVRGDPQIATVYGTAGWAFEHYEKVIAGMRNAADAIGLHVHSYRWLEAAQDWLVDQGNAAWVEHCTALALDVYRDALEDDCRAFRYGDRWLSLEAIRYLDTRGVAFDVTLEPEQREAATFHPAHPATGLIPATFDAPLKPYRPTATDLFGGDGPALAIWMVPLSIARVPEPWAPLRRLPRPLRDLVPRYPDRLRPLRLDGEPSFFREAVRLLARRSGFVRVVVRTDAFARPRPAAAIEENLGWLARQHTIHLTTIAEGMSEVGLAQGSGDANGAPA